MILITLYTFLCFLTSLIFFLITPKLWIAQTSYHEMKFPFFLNLILFSFQHQSLFSWSVLNVPIKILEKSKKNIQLFHPLPCLKKIFILIFFRKQIILGASRCCRWSRFTSTLSRYICRRNEFFLWLHQEHVSGQR